LYHEYASAVGKVSNGVKNEIFVEIGGMALPHVLNKLVQIQVIKRVQMMKFG